MNNESFDDVLVCPYCKGQSVYEYSTDEIEFRDYDKGGNYGHYNVDCYCTDCKKNFRAYMEFNYKIISMRYRTF